MVKKLSLKAFLAQFVGLVPPPGRAYLVMAPHAWGAAASVEKAHKNAQENRVRIYEGKQGWRFIVYNVPADATVDEMGYLCYAQGQQGAVELGRFNMQDDKGEK